MYEQAVVSLIDILGFKHLVRTSSCEKILQTLGRLQVFSGADEVPKYEYSPEVFSFSDLIVRIRKLSPTAKKVSPTGLLILEISDLLRIQALMVDQGILIRGAVTCDAICTSQGLLFGPALIDAYTLESEFARYPRILVSEKALTNLQDTDRRLVSCSDRSYDKAHLRELLRQGDDGFWYVDYLTGCAADLEPEEAYRQFLIRHQQVINHLFELLDKSRGESDNGRSRLLSIYKWLACYHNRCVDELREEWLINAGLDREELRIRSVSVDRLYSF